MDPYVVFIFGQNKQKSEVHEDGGQFPEWKDQTFTFKRQNEPDIVQVQVWNDNLTGDDFLGMGGFSFSKVRKGDHGKLDTVCEIYDEKEEVGSVYLSLEFNLDPACAQHPEVLAPSTKGQIIARPKSAVLLKDNTGWFSSLNPFTVINFGDQR